MAPPKPTQQPKLHVTVVVPDYAVEDFQNQSYSCWIIGHTDQRKITEKIVLELYNKFRESLEDPVQADAMEFFGWLEHEHGYTVFDNTEDGWIELPMNAIDDEEEDPDVVVFDGIHTPCDECRELIPDVTDGELANKHHAESCSLYDPEKE